MSRLLRRQTLIESAQSNPLSHSHILRRPRTHEPLDEVVGLQRPGEHEGSIDDPVREKRKPSLAFSVDRVHVSKLIQILNKGDSSFSSI